MLLPLHIPVSRGWVGPVTVSNEENMAVNGMSLCSAAWKILQKILFGCMEKVRACHPYACTPLFKTLFCFSLCFHCWFLISKLLWILCPQGNESDNNLRELGSKSFPSPASRQELNPGWHFDCNLVRHWADPAMLCPDSWPSETLRW